MRPWLNDSAADHTNAGGVGDKGSKPELLQPFTHHRLQARNKPAQSSNFQPEPLRCELLHSVDEPVPRVTRPNNSNRYFFEETDDGKYCGTGKANSGSEGLRRGKQDTAEHFVILERHGLWCRRC